MKKTIEVIVSPEGEVRIDAVGFKGTACEQATAFLEKALGLVRQRNRKPEYQARNRATRQQRVGS